MVLVLAERVIFQIAELILVCKKIAAIMNNFQLHKLQTKKSLIVKNLWLWIFFIDQ